MNQGLSAFLQNIFKIRPEEFKRVSWAFVYLFCAIGTFIVGRIARSVLFLEIPNYREQLPLAYVIIALIVGMIMYAYARVERSLRRDLTNIITFIVLIAGTILFRWILQSHHHLGYWGFYVWTELAGAILVVQFWTLTNEIFNSRQAKRLFALIGGGGVISNIVFGFAISNVVRSLGTENLLYIQVACMAVGLIAVIMLGKDARHELIAARGRTAKVGHKLGTPIHKKKNVFSSRHVQLIGLVVVLTYLVSTLVDYQFQVIVGDSIPGKDDRSAFLGTFFGSTGILAAFVQFFLTARMLERFGVLFGLLLLPAAMLSGCVGLIVVPLISGLVAASYTKGAENTFRYSVNDTTLQLLYLPLPPETRSQAKAMIDGILKFVAVGLAGVVLALLVGQLDKLVGFSLLGFTVDVYRLGWVTAIALAMWIVTLLALRREYLKTLLNTLQRRRLNFAEANFEINDHGTVAVLEKALGSIHVGEVLHALELLRHVSPKIREPLDVKAVALLFHESEDVRVAALSYLGSTGSHLHGPKVRMLLDDPSSDVRSSATLALCAIDGVSALGVVHHMLEDPDGKVRAHAVAGLIRDGGLDGVLASAELLKKMLSSPQAKDRERAAWVLGRVGVQNFYQPLVPLFDDSDEHVRLAAIIAAGHLRCPQLIESVVRQLDRPRLANAAINALASMGQNILGSMELVLRDHQVPSKVRAQIPKVLARLGHQRCVDILCEFLQDPDPEVRTAVGLGLSALVRSSRFRVPLPVLAQALYAESKAFFELLSLWHDLRLDEHVLLLKDALSHRQDQARNRLLTLLSLKYPTETIDLVGRNLSSTQINVRANATEVLDNLLTKDEKPLVLPVVEDTPIEQKLDLASTRFGLTRRDRLACLRELLTASDTWLNICAAAAVAEWKLAELAPDMQKLTQSKNPVCRETALYVLAHIHNRELIQMEAKKLYSDPAPFVARYAQALLSPGTT